MFGIDAKFPPQKSDNISPYFCGRNPTVLRLRCAIAHKMLFPPNFCCENTEMGMPHIDVRRKLMSLDDMDQDDHIMMIMYTI